MTFDDVIRQYLRMTGPTEVLPVFRRFADERDPRKDWEHFFWLYYVCLLVGVGDVDNAKKVLDAYITGRHGFSGISLFPIASELAVSMGVGDEKICHTAELLGYLRDSDERQDFKMLVKGRRVAIVGNSRSEMGKGVGAQIDDHDIVLRFNNYVLEGFEQDYGTRTDAWIRGFGFAQVQDRTLTESYPYVGISGDYRYIPFCSDEQAVIVYRDIVEKRLNCSYFDPQGFWRLHRLYNEEPTTGLMAIYTCLRFGAVAVDCYGFSFQEEQPSFSHYFSDRENGALFSGLRTVHNLNSESRFLKRLTREFYWYNPKIALSRLIKSKRACSIRSIWNVFNPKLNQARSLWSKGVINAYICR